MTEPYRTIFFLLMQLGKTNDHQGKWKYKVKHSESAAYYIGNDYEHITITATHDGFHHTINGEGRGQHSAKTIEGIIEHIKFNGTDIYTNPDILKALTWLLQEYNKLPVHW